MRSARQPPPEKFPKQHRLRWVKSGAAPLAPELARRFTSLTGVLVCQGYGMTEASPLTHLGYLDSELYRPHSIGRPVCQTECQELDEAGNQVAPGQPGELVMRGPQFMLGYWKEPQATAAALRDGWFWSGDVVTRDEQGFYTRSRSPQRNDQVQRLPGCTRRSRGAAARASRGARLRRSRTPGCREQARSQLLSSC